MLKACVTGFVAIGVIVLGGCRSSDRQPPSAVPRFDPLGVYVNRSAADMYTVALAEHKIIGTCMEQKGFTFTEPAPRLQPQVVDTYGALDALQVGQYGYHVPPGQNGDSDSAGLPADPVERQRYVLARNGSPDAENDPVVDPQGHVQKFSRAGCLGVVDRQLGGFAHFEEPREVLELTLTEARARAESDVRVEAALGRWQKCMKKFGYDATTFEALVEKYEAPGPAPSPVEVQVATRDARCRQSSGYPTVFRSALFSAEAQTLEKTPTAVADFTSAWQTYVKLAASALARS